MSTYLKVVGVISVIGSIVGAIVLGLSFASLNLGEIGFLYFVLILVFGPASGCLFIAVGRILDNTEYSPSYSYKTQNTVTTSVSRAQTKCTKCGKEYDFALSSCPHCGYSKQNANKNTSNVQNENHGWICKKCGYRNSDSVKECGNCFEKRYQ